MKPLGALGLPERLEAALKHKTSQISERAYTNVRFARELSEEVARRVKSAPANLRGRAKRTTFGNTAVSQWLSGANEPSLVVLEVAADILGVRAEWLAFDEGAMAAEGVAPVERKPLVPKTTAKRLRGAREADAIRRAANGGDAPAARRRPGR